MVLVFLLLYVSKCTYGRFSFKNFQWVIPNKGVHIPLPDMLQQAPQRNLGGLCIEKLLQAVYGPEVNSQYYMHKQEAIIVQCCQLTVSGRL